MEKLFSLLQNKVSCSPSAVSFSEDILNGGTKVICAGDRRATWQPYCCSIYFFHINTCSLICSGATIAIKYNMVKYSGNLKPETISQAPAPPASFHFLPHSPPAQQRNNCLSNKAA